MKGFLAKGFFAWFLVTCLPAFLLFLVFYSITPDQTPISALITSLVGLLAIGLLGGVTGRWMYKLWRQGTITSFGFYGFAVPFLTFFSIAILAVGVFKSEIVFAVLILPLLPLAILIALGPASGVSLAISSMLILAVSWFFWSFVGYLVGGRVRRIFAREDFYRTEGRFRIEIEQEEPSLTILEGLAKVERRSRTTPPDNRKETPLEIIKMPLSATDLSFGPFAVDESPLTVTGSPLIVTESPPIVTQSRARSSTGKIKQQTAGQNFPADGYFDLFLEIQVLEQTLHNEEPIRIKTRIDSIPFYGALFEPTQPGPVPLLNEPNQPLGSIEVLGLTFQEIRYTRADTYRKTGVGI